jgi:heme oxygenase
MVKGLFIPLQIDQPLFMTDNSKYNTVGQFDSKRRLLRQQTQAHHQRLNQHALLKGLLSRDFSLAQYQQILWAYAELYQIIEEQIELYLAQHPTAFDYTQRRKSHWLTEDLAYFSETYPGVKQNGKFGCSFPYINSVGQLFGILYVIEGSTLGGQQIAKALVSYHQLTPERGARFFYGYGNQSSSLWETFLHDLETALQEEFEYVRAAKAAQQTFELFLAVLDQSVSRSVVE